MLTEGWDANTVTHILGVRAFGTQLLCEQVIGRGLRRRSYVLNDDGRFDAEYAEVYGVPFSFIPTAGGESTPRPEKLATRVRSIPGRERAEVTFPLLSGYRTLISRDELSVTFTSESEMKLSTDDVPTEVDIAGIVGEQEVHTLDQLRAKREQEVAFKLARRVMQNHYSDAEGAQAWLFPQLVSVVRRWMDDCVDVKDDAFVQLLLLHELADVAASRIRHAVNASNPENMRLLPVFRLDGDRGSSSSVDFDTVRAVYETDPDRCQVSHVVLDSGWEAKVAQSLESMPEVLAYVKNDHLGFVIPYAVDGKQRSYLPDFVVRYNDEYADPLNLVIEVSGESRRDKTEKVATAKNLWVPAVNAHGGFGRWDFIELRDPANTKNDVRGHLDARERVDA
jgi:type III restriction enzyme